MNEIITYVELIDKIKSVCKILGSIGIYVNDNKFLINIDGLNCISANSQFYSSNGVYFASFVYNNFEDFVKFMSKVDLESKKYSEKLAKINPKLKEILNSYSEECK